MDAIQRFVGSHETRVRRASPTKPANEMHRYNETNVQLKRIFLRSHLITGIARINAICFLFERLSQKTFLITTLYKLYEMRNETKLLYYILYGDIRLQNFPTASRHKALYLQS